MKKRNRILALLLTIVMLAGMLPTAAFATEDAPTPFISRDSDGYYLISDAPELVAFAALVNGGTRNVNAKLSADIDMSAVTDYKPIAMLNKGTPVSAMDESAVSALAYSGIFDGQGHVVYNFALSGAYDTGGENGIYKGGLFGLVSGTVKNLVVQGTVTDSSNATQMAGLIGYGWGATVLNCGFVGNVNAYQPGGIIGNTETKPEITKSNLIYNCWMSASTTYNDGIDFNGGGNRGNVIRSHCYYTTDGLNGTAWRSTEAATPITTGRAVNDLNDDTEYFSKDSTGTFHEWKVGMTTPKYDYVPAFSGTSYVSSNKPTYTVTLGSTLADKGYTISSANSVTKGTNAAITVTAPANYVAPTNVTVNMGGVALATGGTTNGYYAFANGAGTVYRVTGNVVVDGTATIGAYTVKVVNNDTANVTVTGTSSQTVTAGQPMTGIKLEAKTKGYRIDPAKVTITSGVGTVKNTNGGIIGTPTGDVTITIASDATTKGRVLLWSTGLQTVGEGEEYIPYATQLEKGFSDSNITVVNRIPSAIGTTQHFTGSENLKDNYDLVVVFQPYVALDTTDTNTLKALLEAGGRAAFVGENAVNFGTQNGYLSTAAATLGATFAITNDPSTATAVNAESRLADGVTALRAAGAAKITYSPPAQWVAGTSDNPWIVDQAAGNKGRITTISDMNFFLYSGFAGVNHDANATAFLLNLLDDSIKNKTAVGAGENPNDDLKGQAAVNITLTNATSVPGIPSVLKNGAQVSYAITAAANYELPASVATNGGLTYTRNTGDTTKATIAGTVTGDVTMTVTATLKKYDVAITAGIGMAIQSPTVPASLTGVAHGTAVTINIKAKPGYVLPAALDSAAVAKLTAAGLAYTKKADGTAAITGNLIGAVASLTLPGATPVSVTPGLTDDGKATLVINPSDKDTQYAVKDGNSNIITTTEGSTAGWTDGKTDGSALTLTVPKGFVAPLQVVSRPKTLGTGTGTDLGDAVSYYYVAGAAGDGTGTNTWAAGDDTTGTGTRATPYASIKTAYEAVPAGKPGVIVVLNDLADQTGFTVSKNVTFTGETAASRPTATFTVKGYQTGIMALYGTNLTVRNLTLKGADALNLRMFEFNGNGHLTLGSGAKVQATATVAYGAVAYLKNATDSITMESGSELSGCKGISVIRMESGGVFHMNGGTITENTVVYYNYNTHGYAGAVDIKGGSVYLSGDAVVNKNVTDKGDAANIYILNGQAVNVTGALTAPAGSIGLCLETMPNTPGAKTEVAVPKDSYTITSGDSKVFFSDKTTEAGILLDGGTVWLSYDARTTVDPGVAPDGKGFITIDPKTGTDYGILVPKNPGPGVEPAPGITIIDKNGKVITPAPVDDKGWITFPGEGGPFTVKPLPTGEEISIVTRPTPGTSDPSAPGPETVDPVAKVTIPTTGGNLTSIIKPGDPDDKAFIVVNPSDDKLTYIVTDPDTGAVLVVKPGDPGKTEIGPLVPGKDYVITTKPKTPTADPTVGTIIAPGTDPYSPGVKVKTPKGEPTPIKPIDPKDIGRVEGTSPNEDKDKIIINPTKDDQEYLVLDPDTGLPVGGSPKTGTGGELTFEPLDPDKDYIITTRNPGDDTANPKVDPSLPLPGITVPGGSHTVDPDDVKPGVTEDGKNTITLPAPTDPDTKYAIVDPTTGEVVAPLTGGDKDGWQTGDPENPLVFAPVDPGKEYVVVTMPKDGADTDGNGEGGNEPSVPGGPSDPTKPYPSKFEPKQPVGPVVKVPTVTEDQLTGKLVPGDPGATPPTTTTATITVKPTDENLIYAVVDPDGNTVVGTWQPGTGKGGEALVFPGLEPGKDYKVVTMTKPGTDDPAPPTTVDPDKGTLITTPVDPTVTKPEGIDRDRITGTGDPTKDGKDKITVTNPGEGFEIAIVDPATGKVITGIGGEGGWIPGTDPATGKLTFQPLDPNKEYEVVIRPTTPKDSIRVPATPGVTVPKVGEVTLSGIVKDKDNKPVVGATVKMTVATPDGGYQTLKATTDKDGKYVLEPNSNIAPGDYAIYVDSGEGVKTQNVTVTQKAQQTIADIIVAKNADPAKNTNIVGGAVSNFGKPVSGKEITVINKQTGATVTPGVGSKTTTTEGGGYTLENLPDGTYFVQTSDGTDSGLTEIKVEGGKIVPNTVGGYKSTNISTTPGGIIDGKVDGLTKGEKATVSITVPIYDEDGDEIGAKTVTAVAEGESGLWKIAGVPDGKYPVTVTTPKGTLTGELTVGGGKATGVTPAAPTTGDDMKVEGNELVVKAPATVDPEKKPGTIVGVAVDKDGMPAKNATVTIYDEKGDVVGTTTTGEGGGYTVTGLPDGKYYVSVDNGGKNGLTGPIAVTGTKTEGKTNVTTSVNASKLLEGVVKDSNGNLVTNTDVVVRDGAGNVIATTKTNSFGQYYVGSIGVANALVVTATGEVGGVLVGEATTENGAWRGDITTFKASEGTMAVIGPDGGVLNMGMGEAIPGKAGVTVATKAEPPVDATAKFEIDGKGNLKAKAGTEPGTYVVTIKDTKGMTVTKEITVDGSEKITTPSPFKITPTTVTGKVTYAVGSIPSDATISIPGFGSAKVNTNTGEYKFTGVPDGEYKATITVVDKNASPTTTSVEVTLTVKDGKAEYSDPKPGVEVGTPKTNLTIKPTAPVGGVNTKIEDAKTAIGEAKTDPTKVPAAITKVKDALGAIEDLTDEGRKQLDPKAVEELSKALTDLMTELHITAGVDAKAEGVTNTGSVQGALENQKGLLVDEKELNTAAAPGTSVDVTLTLKAKDATNEPTPAVQKDMNKVEALATAKNVEKVGYYDVTVEKTTVVKENNAPVSTTTVAVPQLPTAVELKLSIPVELRGYDYYGVVRVHQNGNAERIPSTATATTVTFKSALYSTFAILASNEPIFEDDTAATTDPTPGTGTGTGGSGTGVTVPTHPGGTVTVSPTNPGKGEEIIITVVPDKGYVLDKLTVKDPAGNELTVTPIGGGKYKVTMPDPAVKLTVDATFKKLSNDPHNNGVSDLLNVDDHIAYMKGRSGGKFAPADNMTRAEVAQMFYNLLKTQDTNLGNKASYNDVPADAWYAKAVNTLANIGIVKGVGAGGFAPERTITRAEFIAIAARFANATTGGDTFSDVPATHWAFAEITTATAYGWISGYGDGSFKPGANIARSEAVKVVNAMLARSADKSFVDAATNLVTFSDVPTTDWAYYPIIEATNAHNFTTKDSAETWSAK